MPGHIINCHKILLKDSFLIIVTKVTKLIQFFVTITIYWTLMGALIIHTIIAIWISYTVSNVSMVALLHHCHHWKQLDLSVLNPFLIIWFLTQSDLLSSFPLSFSCWSVVVCDLSLVELLSPVLVPASGLLLDIICSTYVLWRTARTMLFARKLDNTPERYLSQWWPCILAYRIILSVQLKCSTTPSLGDDMV